MNTKATDLRIKLEDILFWISMGSVMTMCVLYIAEGNALFVA